MNACLVHCFQLRRVLDTLKNDTILKPKYVINRHYQQETPHDILQ